MNTEQLTDKLVSWIKEKVLSGGCQGVVIGLSGGLDSSVLAVLCQQAFPQNTLAVYLPCYSSAEDTEHAHMVASKFAIPIREIVLDDTYQNLLSTLPDFPADPTAGKLAQANLKVRLRMVVLYYMANQLNYMVAGSSNRSELATGYFTKYGDGGVDLLPLGNLLKGQVVALAKSLGIPRPIIDKPPSAGLWTGQTDETEMGFSYEQLDRYLLTGEAPAELKNKIEAMIANSNHKRSLPPVAKL